jgi:predicted DNA-binding protein
MSHTISVRLNRELAEWLRQTSARTGLPQGRIVRDKLERARAEGEQPFLALAGVVKNRPKDLSSRKGFSRE